MTRPGQSISRTSAEGYAEWTDNPSRQGYGEYAQWDAFGAWDDFEPIATRIFEISAVVRDPDLPAFTHTTSNEFALRVVRGLETSTERGGELYQERFNACRRKTS